jgi:hypothetical protein
VNRDRNCLSNWFPRLLDAGLPVPRTEIIKTKIDLASILDGETPDGYDYEDFLEELEAAAMRISPTGPWFLRTGLGSGKHEWKKTCFVTDLESLWQHVSALVNWSNCVDFFGLAHDVWVVREMLPTEPILALPGYGDMPLVPEIRAFVRDGEIVCRHEYWPVNAIDDGLRVYGPSKRLVSPETEEARLARSHALYSRLIGPVEMEESRELAQRTADVFKGDGAWSVDLLKTKNGWYVTDCADAAMSFHMPGCDQVGKLDEKARAL